MTAQTDLELKLQNEIDALVSRNKDVFSVVLGVTDIAGAFHWTGAAGTAHPDGVEVMTADTPIFVASITKMVTAAATMILEERGLLALGDPLSKFLPPSLLEGLHIYKGRDYSDQLTIYHLISQTSGLPDYFEEKSQNGTSLLERLVTTGDMGWDVADVARIAKSDLSPKFPPESREQENSGNKAYYADTNYQLLGAVIELAAHRPLSELFSELIIEPLALSSTYLHGRQHPAVDSSKQPATIYYKTKPLYLDRAMTSFGPDGGLVSTIGDSLKFFQHLLEGQLFAHPATLQKMKSWRKIFFPFQYGLGLMRFKLPRILSPFSATPELIGHSGASSSFLYFSDIGRLYIGGTLNQLENRRRPINVMIKVTKLVDEALS